MNKEKRYYSNVSFRAAEENGKMYFTGYGSVFNERSKLIFENYEFFYEEIRAGAFDDVLAADNLNVILTFQHDRSEVLARFTKRDGNMIADTLELSVDDKGLKFRTEMPNTSRGRDIAEQLKRGDLFECSFVFSVKEDGYRWEYVEGLDEPLRVVERVAGLFDVSIVVDGAYANTDIEVAARELKEFKKDSEIVVEKVIDEVIEVDEVRNNADILKMKTVLLKLK